jgi:Tol biopolymer transport system component
VAFVSSVSYGTQSDIYTMNPDGSDRKQLTFSQEHEGEPAWSPDGTKIAFASLHLTGNGGYSEIFVMNADGSDQRRLTQSKYDRSPAWSPDGTKIAFWHLDSITMPSSWGIFVMNADGSGQRAVVSTYNSGLQQPAWSPDGLKFAVANLGSGISLINVDGSNQTQITQPPSSFEDVDPAWSPDGSKITFARCVDSNGFGCYTTSHLWGVNADGSNPTKLTDTLASTHTWSPDGTKIIFGSVDASLEPRDLFVMNPDGSGLTNITNTDGALEWSPSWQALRLTLPNPIDDPQFFVRQHYLDFLGREPDPLAAQWVNLINDCPPGDSNCDRIHVSEAFFKSPEFQERGYFLYRFYPAAFGRKPDFGEFMPDLQRVSGFLTPAELEAAKAAFINDFMMRNAFRTKYDLLSNQAYVDELLATAGVSLSNRQALIDALNSGSRSRGQVLRQIVEAAEVHQGFYNQAFVVMQYFGYLRRDPDILYLNWIATLDANPADSRHMIAGFVNSIEYRARFGAP